MRRLALFGCAVFALIGVSRFFSPVAVPSTGGVTCGPALYAILNHYSDSDVSSGDAALCKNRGESNVVDGLVIFGTSLAAAILASVILDDIRPTLVQQPTQARPPGGWGYGAPPSGQFLDQWRQAGE